MRTIYDVLKEIGYASRAYTEFADFDDRNFKINTDVKAGIVVIFVAKRVGSLRMGANYTFNLNNQVTNATAEEIEDLQRILDIQPFTFAEEKEVKV